jgi:2-hydroxychromene-2-carboxylate isomerase
VLALRCLLAAPSDDWQAVVDAFFRIYWHDQLDIANAETLRQRLDALGLDGAALLHKAETQAIKDDLRRRTAEAVALGIFGAPAFVVDDRLFWGADRMDMVALAAHGWNPEAGRDEFQF